MLEKSKENTKGINGSVLVSQTNKNRCKDYFQPPSRQFIHDKNSFPSCNHFFTCTCVRLSDWRGYKWMAKKVGSFHVVERQRRVRIKNDKTRIEKKIRLLKCKRIYVTFSLVVKRTMCFDKFPQRAIKILVPWRMFSVDLIN